MSSSRKSVDNKDYIYSVSPFVNTGSGSDNYSQHGNIPCQSRITISITYTIRNENKKDKPHGEILDNYRIFYLSTDFYLNAYSIHWFLKLV